MGKKASAQPAVEVELKRGERIELTLCAAGQESRFVSRIQKAQTDMLTCEMPVRLSGELRLQQGQSIQVVINRQPSALANDALVVAVGESSGDLVTLRLVGKWQPVQRRRFVRIEIDGEISFCPISGATVSETEPTWRRKGEILNLSASGVLFATTCCLASGDYILLDFRLKPNQRLENIIGVVKRVEKQDDEYLVGVEFLTKECLRQKEHWAIADVLPAIATFFDDELEKHVVRFVYDHQVQERKKKASKEMP